MFTFCFIELELKLCILHFESQFKQTENCANFHLVKPEGGGLNAQNCLLIISICFISEGLEVNIHNRVKV